MIHIMTDLLYSSHHGLSRLFFFFFFLFPSPKLKLPRMFLKKKINVTFLTFGRPTIETTGSTCMNCIISVLCYKSTEILSLKDSLCLKPFYENICSPEKGSLGFILFYSIYSFLDWQEIAGITLAVVDGGNRQNNNKIDKYSLPILTRLSIQSYWIIARY